MWLFRKYDRLKRESVVKAIVDLQERETEIERRIDEASGEIETLMQKGKNETDRTRKLFYAKKINAIKSELDNNIQRAMALMYNIQLLGKLKDAIDDKNFVTSVGKVPLNKLLGDQKGLAKFLNKALNRKIAMEDIMTSADDTFAEVAGAYEPNKQIFGVNAADDDLLAMFEIDNSLGDDVSSSSVNKKEAQANG
jgi:hypothetical protein